MSLRWVKLNFLFVYSIYFLLMRERWMFISVRLNRVFVAKSRLLVMLSELLKVWVKLSSAVVCLGLSGSDELVRVLALSGDMSSCSIVVSSWFRSWLSA